MMIQLLKTLGEFRREDGNVTVESALRVPFFVLLLTLMADAALVFYGQARALQIAQDGNRAYSIGQLTSTEATETFIEQELDALSPNAVAQTTTYRGLITTVVTVPTSDLAAVGIFTALASVDMQVVAQMVQEN